MKELLCSMILCLSLMIKAQTKINDQVEKTNNGIKWTERLPWEEIKQKARTEGKYIFVDCYASWCAPCKQMDKDVYSNDSVADHMNPNFISVRLQMDTSKQDNKEIRDRYSDAHNF